MRRVGAVLALGLVLAACSNNPSPHTDTRLADAYAACPSKKLKLTDHKQTLLVTHLRFYHSHFETPPDTKTIDCVFAQLKASDHWVRNAMYHSHGHAANKGLDYEWTRRVGMPFTDFSLVITLAHEPRSQQTTSDDVTAGSTRLYGYGPILIRVPTSWPSDVGYQQCGNRSWYSVQRSPHYGDAPSPCTPITSSMSPIRARTQDAVVFGKGDPGVWLADGGSTQPDQALADASVRTEVVNGVSVKSRSACGPIFRPPPILEFCRAVWYLPSQNLWVGVGSMRPGSRTRASDVVHSLLGSIDIDLHRRAAGSGRSLKPTIIPGRAAG